MNFDMIKDPAVREYMMRKQQDSAALEDSRGMQDIAGYAGIGTQLLNDFNRSKRKDVILNNRLQDLGRGPNVVKGEVNELDPNLASNIANIGVNRAKEDAAKTDKDFRDKMDIERYGRDKEEYGRKKEEMLQAKDPNSEESKQARNFLRYVAPGLGDVPGYENMSAEKLEKIAPVLMQKYRADRSAEATKNRLDIQRQAAKYKREEKRDQDIEKNVQKLSKDISGIQGINNAVKSVEDIVGFDLNEYDPKNNTVAGKPLKDLPGVSVPGVGRVSFYDEDARAVETAISKVFNTELKDRSGAAVTTPEMERLKIEFASGKFNTEQEMITALKRYKELATQELKNREAAYSSEVKDTYRQRGGQTSDSFNSRTSQAPQNNTLKASDLP